MYGAISERTRLELEDLGQLNTSRGAAAMIMAGWMDNPVTTDSGIVAVSRELDRLRREIKSDAGIRESKSPTTHRRRKAEAWRVLEGDVGDDP